MKFQEINGDMVHMTEEEKITVMKEYLEREYSYTQLNDEKIKDLFWFVSQYGVTIFEVAYELAMGGYINMNWLKSKRVIKEE